MCTDFSSVLAALTSHGAPSVTGTTIEVASPQGCTAGLAGPERSCTFNHPEQHLQILPSFHKPKLKYIKGDMIETLKSSQFSVVCEQWRHRVPVGRRNSNLH